MIGRLSCSVYLPLRLYFLVFPCRIKYEARQGTITDILIHRSGRDHRSQILRSRSTVMALQTTVLEPAPGSSEESGILSDEQIEQLLHEAEARLKEASNLTVQATIASEHEDVIPVGSIRKRKLYVCNCLLQKPVITTNLKIAKAHR